MVISNWDRVSLGDVCRVEAGAGFPIVHQGLKDQEFPFFKVGDMNTAGNEKEMHVFHHSISEEICKKLRATAFPAGTIVFPKIGAAIATNKKRMLVKPSCVDNNVMALIPSGNLDSSFLFYLLLNKDLSDFANTGNPPSIRQSNVEEWTIPLPPLTEQKRIASLLGRADRLRHLRRTAHELGESLLQSVFLEMFGEYLKPSHPFTPMEELVKITGGGTPSRDVPEYFTGNIPWLTSKDMRGDYIYDTQEYITEKAIKESATNLVPVGSILLVVKSKILMRRLPIAVTKVPLCHGQYIKSIQCSNKVNPLFLVHVLKHNEQNLLNQARGANTEGLTLPMLNEIKVPNVPLSLQEEFAGVVARVESLRGRMAESTRQVEGLFESLLAESFG